MPTVTVIPVASPLFFSAQRVKAPTMGVTNSTTFRRMGTSVDPMERESPSTALVRSVIWPWKVSSCCLGNPLSRASRVLHFKGQLPEVLTTPG